MPRTARKIAPHYPHLITQYGNRGIEVFKTAEDYTFYLETLLSQAERYSVHFKSYCLLPNQVALLAVPDDKDGLALCLREAHRLYTKHVNESEGCTGHLWHGRFASFPMEDGYARKATSFIENKPVRAGIVKEPHHYRWSSAKYHIGRKEFDPLLTPQESKSQARTNWDAYLKENCQNENDNAVRLFKKHEKSGLPLTKLSTAI